MLTPTETERTCCGRLYQRAYPIPPGVVNDDPWEYNQFDGYNRGNALVNETCKATVAYMSSMR